MQLVTVTKSKLHSATIFVFLCYTKGTKNIHTFLNMSLYIIYVPCMDTTNAPSQVSSVCHVVCIDCGKVNSRHLVRPCMAEPSQNTVLNAAFLIICCTRHAVILCHLTDDFLRRQAAKRSQVFHLAISRTPN